MTTRSWLIASLVLLAVSATEAAAIQAAFCVAPGGSDANPGSETRPFATLERARQAVRGMNKEMTDDVIHVFQGGSIQMLTDVSIDPAGNVWGAISPKPQSPTLHTTPPRPGVEKLKENIKWLKSLSPRIKVGGYAFLAPLQGTYPYDQRPEWLLYNRSGKLNFNDDGTGPEAWADFSSGYREYPTSRCRDLCHQLVVRDTGRSIEHFSRLENRVGVRDVSTDADAQHVAHKVVGQVVYILQSGDMPQLVLHDGQQVNAIHGPRINRPQLLVDR